MVYIDVTILFWNVFVMLVYSVDKIKAKRKRWRVRESVLLLLAAFFGGFGAMCGMVLFNHKTSKMKFRILVPLCAVFQLVVAILLYKTGIIPYNQI